MQSLIHTPWLSIGACLLLYMSDVAFTMTCSRLYQSGSMQHLAFEHSLELTPRYQKDVARLRWLSPKFLISLLLLAAVMALVWWIAVDLGLFPGFYEFALGSWILLELALHVRHFRNLITYYHFKRSEGVDGKITYRTWLSYRVSSVDLLGFTLLFLILFPLTRRLFVLGGAFGCLAVAFDHWRKGQKARKAAEA